MNHINVFTIIHVTEKVTSRIITIMETPTVDSKDGLLSITFDNVVGL